MITIVTKLLVTFTCLKKFVTPCVTTGPRVNVSPVYGEAEDDAYLKTNLYFLSEIRDCLDLFSTKMTLIAK